MLLRKVVIMELIPRICVENEYGQEYRILTAQYKLAINNKYLSFDFEYNLRVNE